MVSIEKHSLRLSDGIDGGITMKLYKNSNGVWAGTQADARKYCGKDYQTVDVPTDKPNLLGFLNLNQVGSLASSPALEEVRTGEPNKEAMSWFRWAYDCMMRGQYDDAKEMLKKGLVGDGD
tara:strand:+ start:119 stop:481 length:363 start_codon:yes stop_codon:yes gene_type:complete